MGRLTNEQAQQLADLQALADAPDDDDYEVWIKSDKGHETRIPSRRAGGYLKEHFGISLHDDPDPAGADPAPDPEPDPKPAAAGGYFGKRRG